jgi:hypothetical protein
LRLPRGKRKNFALALRENAHPGLLHSVKVAAAVSTFTSNRRTDPETLSLYCLSLFLIVFLFPAALFLCLRICRLIVVCCIHLH